MTKPDFTLKFIKDAGDLRRLSERLVTLPACALDIETSEWWNRHRERIALIQFAYRSDNTIKVVILDALAGLDFELLRLPLEKTDTLKIIHNAAFDAARLKTHYGFNVSPVFDTMSAARRAGERKYSLKAQAEIHLKLRIDKSAQASDWSRRPLDLRQLHYAALDPYATLLLYEDQVRRGLFGDYRLRSSLETKQNLLPLETVPPAVSAAEKTLPKPEIPPSKLDLTEEIIAILGIIAELPSRYHPEGLAASIGGNRVGIAGWIIDRKLGVNAEPDEETVKLAINDLCEKKLIEVTDTRRLQATNRGIEIWQKLKS